MIPPFKSAVEAVMVVNQPGNLLGVRGWARVVVYALLAFSNCRISCFLASRCCASWLP